MTKHFVLLAAVLVGVASREAQAQWTPRGGFEEPRDPIVDIFIVAGGYAGYTLGKNQEHSDWFGGKAPVWSVLTGAVVGANVCKQVQDHFLGEDYDRRRMPRRYPDEARFVRLRGTDTVGVESIVYGPDGYATAGRSGSIASDERMAQRAGLNHQPGFLVAGTGRVTRVTTLRPGVLHVDYGDSDLQAEMQVDLAGRIQSATYMSRTDVVTVRRLTVQSKPR